MMEKIDFKKPTMVIDYMLEAESSEKYIYDYAAEIGIKIDEDDPYSSFNHCEKQDIFTPRNYAFCHRQGTFISIAEMEKFIAKAKEKGATHLDIHHHGDHGNYNMYALQFRLINEKELEKVKSDMIKKTDKTLQEINLEIEKLENRKKKLLK